MNEVQEVGPEADNSMREPVSEPVQENVNLEYEDTPPSDIVRRRNMRHG